MLRARGRSGKAGDSGSTNDADGGETNGADGGGEVRDDIMLKRQETTYEGSESMDVHDFNSTMARER